MSDFQFVAGLHWPHHELKCSLQQSRVARPLSLLQRLAVCTVSVSRLVCVLPLDLWISVIFKRHWRTLSSVDSDKHYDRCTVICKQRFAGLSLILIDTTTSLFVQDSCCRYTSAVVEKLRHSSFTGHYTLLVVVIRGHVALHGRSFDIGACCMVHGCRSAGNFHVLFI